MVCNIGFCGMGCIYEPSPLIAKVLETRLGKRYVGNRCFLQTHFWIKKLGYLCLSWNWWSLLGFKRFLDVSWVVKHLSCGLNSLKEALSGVGCIWECQEQVFHFEKCRRRQHTMACELKRRPYSRMPWHACGKEGLLLQAKACMPALKTLLFLFSQLLHHVNVGILCAHTLYNHLIFLM